MLSFMNYNFCFDSDALNYAYSPSESVDNISITNSTFDYVNIESYNNEPKPDRPAWNNHTIFFPDFECTSTTSGTLDAGNIGFISGKISAIRIKKRLKGTFKWITVYEIPVNSPSDLTFSYYDYSCRSGKEYDWAAVMMINDVEGEYITDTVLSSFDSAVLSDATGSFKLTANYSNSTITVHAPASVVETTSNRYPYVFRNGDVKYDSGSVKCVVISDEAISKGNNGIVESYEVDLQEKILQFITNGNTKILKDTSGRAWLISIVDNPSVESFDVEPLVVLSFNWVEVGDVNDEYDMQMYNVGYEVGV